MMTTFSEGNDRNSSIDYLKLEEKLAIELEKKLHDYRKELKEKEYDDKLSKEIAIVKKVADAGFIATEEELKKKTALEKRAAQENFEQRSKEEDKARNKRYKEERDELRKKQQEELAVISEQSLEYAEIRRQQEKAYAELLEKQKAARAEEKKARQEAHQEELDKIETENEAKYTQGKKLAEKTRRENEVAEAKRKKEKEKEDAKKREKEKRDSAKKDVANVGEAFRTLKPTEIKGAMSDLFSDSEGNKGAKGFEAGLDKLAVAMSDFAKTLETNIDSIARKMANVDTALQGTSKSWAEIGKNITGSLAISPFVKQEDVANRVEEMVQRGINFDVEQRAFLSVIKDKIAGTFDVFDGTLLRLIRIQQKDSTATRLGMESAMTAFLNNMYETSEYLKEVASSVRGNLQEAEALMTSNEAIDLEFAIQKWLGSLYSVGMSQDAISNISLALGQVASGNIEGITNGGTSNLLLMAANRAGIPIDKVLKEGLTGNTASLLMQSMVQYLANTYTENKENKVVQQQLAKVFGIKASDLLAAANAASSLTDITSYESTSSSALSRLYDMSRTAIQRTSMGEMLQNLTQNFQYTLASGIANNPALYMIYKTAGLLDGVASGINIPSITAFGTGVDLNATVADLMRVAALSGSIISGIAGVIGAGSGGGLSLSKTLEAFGVGNETVVQRGSGSLAGSSSNTFSESGYITNTSAEDVKKKTMDDANNDADKQMVEAKEDEDSDIPRKDINENVIKIYSLLKGFADGTEVMSVSVKDYGLVWNK